MHWCNLPASDSGVGIMMEHWKQEKKKMKEERIVCNRACRSHAARTNRYAVGIERVKGMIDMVIPVMTDGLFSSPLAATVARSGNTLSRGSRFCVLSQ
jgi:hypothetical protein